MLSTLSILRRFPRSLLCFSAASGIQTARIFASLFGSAICLVATPSFSQEVDYSEVDRAVVRVLALGTPDLVEVEHRRRQYQFGVPGGGHGTGTILTEDGLVLTAAHVVSGERALAVHVPGQEHAVTARVLFADDEKDYALLQIPGAQAHVATLCETGTSFKVREEVFALGYPLDSTRKEAQSSRGVVSGKLDEGALQLDMSLNPGNSGGPVIAKGEQVCAMVVARSDPEKGAIGLAKAVSLESMRAKIDEWKARERPSVTADAVDEGVASLLSLLATTGSEWFVASLEASESQDDQNEVVEELARKYPKSADVQLLTAVYLWNRYSVRRATGRERLDLKERAIGYAERAVAVDASLKTDSPFVQFILDRGRYQGGSRPRYHDGFFLRAGSGLTYANRKRSGYEGTSKFAVPIDVLLGGGSLVTAGVVFQMLQGLDTGTDTGHGATLSGFSFGGFAQVHPIRDGGLGIQMRVTLNSATFTPEATTEYEQSEAAFGISAGAGYDFWFANQWSAGVNASGTFLSSDTGWEILPTLGVAITLH